MVILASIWLVAFKAVVIGAYSLPETCTGTCINTHDPSIIRRSEDGTYFRFSTGGKIAVHSAPSIRGPWAYQGAAIPAGSSINLPGRDDLWAPDVTRVDGDTPYYYLYYSVSRFGSQDSAIGVARSGSLNVGTWEDLGPLVRSDPSKPYNAIDPNLVAADGASGGYLMTFGSWWDGLHQVAMSSPTTVAASSSALSPARQVARDPDNDAEEGAFLFRYGELYYLFYSKGTCCGYDASRPRPGSEYRIMVCRSASPTGDFVDKSGISCTNGGGTVVLESHSWVYGPGGQGVYQDTVEGPILYYHYVDTRIGYADGQKKFGWNKIDFSTGWPAV